MACLSPSPSGRRLSELLEEKQEPFVLDLHLLEKGCSSRLLDGYDTALCWPASAGNDAAAAVLRRLTSKQKNKPASKKKPQPAGGLLRLLLSKILRGRTVPPPPKPAKLQFSDSFKIAGAAVAPAPPSPCAVKTAAAEKECCGYSDDGEYSYSDDDEKQQLSPVSVLEPHPFEMSSPGRRHGGGAGKVSPSRSAAMDVFRELLDAAYSPALLTQLLAKTDDLLLLDDAADEDVAGGDDGYYYRSSPKNCRDDETAAAAYWDAHRAELVRVSELVAAEVPASKVAAGDVGPERRDVGAEVEAAVFDALVMELVADLGSGCRC
ncbi:unnamed protein product [Urochloa decumbens]|uniref:DUF4378 domain-containing protein n=1 Tax=Urochloa decumbens TaxID=240449 RepID=A0ABC9B3Z8_9POAL